MADLSDVENALVAAIASAVYPTGTGGASTIGAPCRIYRGWPVARALDADLAAGTVNITVFSRPGITRNTTRHFTDWHDIANPTPTITVATAGQVVTFGGTAGTGNLCGIRSNGVGYAYAAAATDTPTAVATALAALVPGAVASGATVTVAAGLHLLGRVVSIGTAMRETRRQVQGFLVSCWCPNYALRDTAAGVVDSYLAPIEFLPLADGTGGRLKYQSTFINDAPTKDNLWRRDLVYSVEYPTTQTTTAPELLWGGGTVTASTVVTNLIPQ